MSAIDHFRQTLRELCTAFENEAIENMVYFDAILETRSISLVDLQERVRNAQADPEKRKKVHQMYSEMWKAIEQSGTDAFFEDLLKDLPPTDKPN